MKVIWNVEMARRFQKYQPTIDRNKTEAPTWVENYFEFKLIIINLVDSLVVVSAETARISRKSMFRNERNIMCSNNTGIGVKKTVYFKVYVWSVTHTGC